MGVNAKSEMKRAFHVLDGAADIQNQAVWVGGGDGQAVGLGELAKGLIILFQRAEAGGELVWLEELMEEGAGGIVELLKQVGQGGAVAEWEADGQAQLLGGGEAARRGQALGDDFGDVPHHLLGFDRPGGGG